MKTKTCLAFLLSVSAAQAFGQSPPGSIPVGPLFVYPELELAVRRDSNIALQPANARVADTIYLVRPSVRVEAKKGPDFYNIGYRGEYGRYKDTSRFDFENHELYADAAMLFDARNRLNVRLQYLDRVDAPGTLNIAATPTPNQYHQPTVQGLYSFGAEDAQGKLELQGGYFEKRYVNNRATTAVLDNNQTDYGATFLWRIQPKTYGTFTLRQSQHDYVTPGVTLDSTDTFALVGLRWDATALTSGRFAIGRQKKDFDSGLRNDTSLVSWEGGINWKPLSYSSVDLSTRRATNESTGLGDYSDAHSYNATWTHAWSSRVTSNVLASYGTDRFRNQFVAAAGGERDDKTTSGGLRMTYEFRRWLKFGAEFIRTDRDSNDPNFDYKRNQFMLLMSATL